MAIVGSPAIAHTAGDPTVPSYDNALAEFVVGLYKTERVRQDGPFRSVEDVELATLSWVHWFSQDRLHGALGHVPPIEFKTDHDRHINPRQQPLWGEPSLH